MNLLDFSPHFVLRVMIIWIEIHNLVNDLYTLLLILTFYCNCPICFDIQLIVRINLLIYYKRWIV